MYVHVCGDQRSISSVVFFILPSNFFSLSGKYSHKTGSTWFSYTIGQEAPRIHLSLAHEVGLKMQTTLVSTFSVDAGAPGSAPRVCKTTFCLVTFGAIRHSSWQPSEESQNIWKWQHKIWDCLPIYCQVDNCQSTAEWLSNKQMTALSIWVNAQSQCNDRVGSSLDKFGRKQTGERKQIEQPPLWHLLESGVGLSRLPLCAREREKMGR